MIRSAVVLVAALAVLAPAPAAHAEPPRNDDLADAAPLPLGTTTDFVPGEATTEPGERAVSGCSRGAPKAVWFAVTPEETTSYRVTLDGALRYETTTLIGVFRGPADATSPADLTRVDCANEPFRTNSAHLSFTARAGSTYYVQAGLTGPESDDGRVLSLSAAVVDRPANDDFADRSTIEDASGSTYLDTTLASPQRRDPRVVPVRRAGGHSLWYSWTAPATGDFRFATRPDLRSVDNDWVDTTLGVYTGETLDSLTPVALDRVEPDADFAPWSRLVLSAEAGRTYAVLVDGDPRAERFRAFGPLELTWKPVP